jgi:acyl-CoA thioesterase
MEFSKLLAAMRGQDGKARVDVGDDWTQGRSLFGGLQAVIALSAMRSVVPSDVPLRVLQVTFLAPVPAGVVSAEARVLRAGKNVVHVEARLLVGNDVACLVVGVFGRARRSEVNIVPPGAPSVEGEGHLIDYNPATMPAFVTQFRRRLFRGAMLFAGSKATSAVVDIDVIDTGPVTESHVVAVADVLPPLALSHLTTRAPGSSVTWMLEFFATEFEHLSLERFRVHAELVAARDGYTSQSQTIFAADGTHLAFSRQSMVIFG